MIKTLKLKFGKTPDSPPEPISLNPITVFVGPNNSGKSLILTELYRRCTSGTAFSTDLMLEALEFIGFSEPDADRELAGITVTPRPGDNLLPGNALVGFRSNPTMADLQYLKNSMLTPDADRQSYFCACYLKYKTLKLDGSNRIVLLSPQEGADLQQPSTSSFQVLFKNDALREEVRRIVHNAFGRYLVVDPTNLGQLRIRLSSRPPTAAAEERGIDARAVKFHAEANPIEEFSNGVKAFTGIVIEVITGNPHTSD